MDINFQEKKTIFIKISVFIQVRHQQKEFKALHTFLYWIGQIIYFSPTSFVARTESTTRCQKRSVRELKNDNWL